MRKSLMSFSASRAFPLIGVSIIFSLMAYSAPRDLVLLSYVLALFSLVTAIVPMLLVTSGNLTASFTQESEKKEFFSSGFTVALGLSGMGLFACCVLLAISLSFPGVQNLDSERFITVTIIYFLSVPFVPINFFMQVFHEASGNHSSVSKIKTFSTLLGIAFAFIAFFLVIDEGFKCYAIGYFFITESITFSLLLRISRGNNFISFVGAKKIASKVLIKSLPIASGIAGQKLYFYLVIERLTQANPMLASKLAIYMSVISVVLIPTQSLGQIHSLQISKFPYFSARNYYLGGGWAIGLVFAISVGLYMLGGKLFLLVGDGNLIYDLSTHAASTYYILSNVLLALTMAHLRAKNDTATPQVLINFLMLAIVIPLLYSFVWVSQQLSNLLFLQGSAILVCALLLHIRIVRTHKKEKSHLCSKIV